MVCGTVASGGAGDRSKVNINIVKVVARGHCYGNQRVTWMRRFGKYVTLFSHGAVILTI